MAIESGKGQQGSGANEKIRHGCLSAYLLVMMGLSLVGAVSYLVLSEQALALNDPELPESIRRPVMVIVNILIGVCSFAIWKRRKWGFWGFVVVGLAGGLLKACLSPEHRGGLVFGVLGSLLLYGVLRIGKDRQGWKQLG